MYRPTLIHRQSLVAAFVLTLSSANPSFALDEEGGASFGPDQRNRYLRTVCFHESMYCALAVSTDGAYGMAAEMLETMARNKALQQCRRAAVQTETCAVIDVGGTSSFLSNENNTSEPIPTRSQPATAIDQAVPTETSSSSESASSSLRTKLLELRSLVEEGLISEEDYDSAKSRLLDNY